MAGLAGLINCHHRLIWQFGCLLVLFGYSAVATPSHGRRLLCWQAILMCQGEAECNYAYGQYMHACASIINGEKRKCPSHCISSLVQLNLTKNGPYLEDCDCSLDPICRNTKRAIEPCLPRTSTMGCTEARHQCERDGQCSAAMRDYLIHCGKLFSGVRCTDACRDVIFKMRSIPKAELLDTCVCDGTERTICEYVKLSMKTLCFDSPDKYAGSGFSDSEEDSDDEYDSQDYPQYEENAGSFRGPQNVLTVVASILVLLPVL
ncbi:growth arrest-specific protein 1-like [Megalops cyprinoides]|uniref:growth arrest-specific protein 1-like n=1 Tax=Megalops cyprinoides TaxID=118141 RepID=UPI0018644E30|nr:growth arrest-specific protein 1-like [Megalops cyprinoides]